MNQKKYKDQVKLALQQLKDMRFNEAEKSLTLLIEKYPNEKELLLYIGLLASQTGRPEMTKVHIEKYLKQNPDDITATGILAVANFDLKNYENAKTLFEFIIKKVNNSSTLYYNLGQTYYALQMYPAALNAFSKATTLEPNFICAQIGLAVSLKELNKPVQAKVALSKAITVEPSNPKVHFFLGNVLRDLGDLEASVNAYTQALKYNANYIEAAINCGNSYKDMGLATEAIDCYDIALMIDPNHPEANYNKSLVLLNEAKFEDGWRLYDWRFNSSEAQNKFVQQPMIEGIGLWNGDKLGDNLLVLPEQGIGDQVFFLGMLPDLQQRVKSLMVGADSRLTPLLRRTYPEINFIQNASDVDTSRVNAQIHMGSLGQHLRRNENSFSTVVSPYLMADKLQSAALRQSMKADGKLLCGISWLSKNADHGNAKSLSLTALKDALTLPGFDFVDLQYGDTQHEREQFHADHGVHVIKRNEIDNFKDIDGLASLIDACDLVVTVSNTTAHLACALGKPTLVLLPKSSAVFWYWHRKGMHSPWYPTAVMLRQEELGGWPQVVGAVRHILQGMQ